MDPAVAARLAASPSSSSARTHSSSSPSTARLAHSSSVTGLNSEDALANAPTTVEKVLAAHASATNPTRAALESVVQERNTLSAQNSLLWNHLRKQRSNYQMAASDVKRIRAERDALRAKLARYDHTFGSEHFDDRQLRPSPSNAHTTASTSSDTNVDADDSMVSDPGYGSQSNSKPKMSRHPSEDRPGTPRLQLCSCFVHSIIIRFDVQDHLASALHRGTSILMCNRIHTITMLRECNSGKGVILILSSRLLAQQMVAKFPPPRRPRSMPPTQPPTGAVQTKLILIAYSMQPLPRHS